MGFKKILLGFIFMIITSSPVLAATFPPGYQQTLDKSSALATINSNNISGFIDIDITQAVKQKQGGILSIAIDTTSGDGIKFYSKENSTDKPALIIQ